MSSSWSKLKVIKIEDLFLVKFGGHSGYDYKLIMKKPEWRHHYTVSVGIPPSFRANSLPIYVHRTEETQPKQYTELARGAFDMEALARSMLPDISVEVESVDLTSSEFSGQEIIPFSHELLELFSHKKLLIDRGMLHQFQPKPISEFNERRFGIGFPSGTIGCPRLVIKADSSAYAFRFPTIENVEDKLEKAMGIKFVGNSGGFEGEFSVDDEMDQEDEDQRSE